MKKSLISLIVVVALMCTMITPGIAEVEKRESIGLQGPHYVTEGELVYILFDNPNLLRGSIDHSENLIFQKVLTVDSRACSEDNLDLYGGEPAIHVYRLDAKPGDEVWVSFTNGEYQPRWSQEDVDFDNFNPDEHWHKLDDTKWKATVQSKDIKTLKDYISIEWPESPLRIGGSITIKVTAPDDYSFSSDVISTKSLSFFDSGIYSWDFKVSLDPGESITYLCNINSNTGLENIWLYFKNACLYNEERQVVLDGEFMWEQEIEPPLLEDSLRAHCFEFYAGLDSICSLTNLHALRRHNE